jgi:hypothetical protein
MTRVVSRLLTRGWGPLYWTLTLVGATYCALVLLGVVPYGGCTGELTMCDGAAYYFAPDDPYRWDLRPEGVAPYRYAPAFLIAFAPLRLLPWEVFGVVWFGLHVAAFVWLRAGWMLAVPGLQDDVIRGNVTVFLAVAVVLGLTRSAAWWMPVLLTKVTPGIGVVWHLARREWREFAFAIGATAVVVALGFTLSPGLWVDWLRSLAAGPESYEVGHPLGPLPLRLVLAAAVTAYAGLTDRAWLLPVGLLVAVPGLWPLNFALLAAIPRLRTVTAATRPGLRPVEEPAAATGTP